MEIVFVHFGMRIPKYLISNLNRTCALLPNAQITLITDQKEFTEINRDNFRIYQMALGDEYYRLDSGLSHPKDFRKNFWFSSLARLVALSDYVISNGKPILHIESDVIISKDFPANNFAELDRQLSYTLIGPQSGVASVLWIGGIEGAKFLRKFVKESVFADPNTTDMKILGKLQAQYPLLVRALASFPISETSAYSELPLSLSQDFLHTENLFGGLFDAADIGQYLLGDDPRNHRGFKILRRELATSYLGPRKLKYTFSQERDFVGVSADRTLNLFSLHIHSKNSKVFGLNSSGKCLKAGVCNQGNPEASIFVLSVFLKSVLLSALRRLKVTKEKFLS